MTRGSVTLVFRLPVTYNPSNIWRIYPFCRMFAVPPAHNECLRKGGAGLRGLAVFFDNRKETRNHAREQRDLLPNKG
jgi:hypothetical protein